MRDLHETHPGTGSGIRKQSLARVIVVPRNWKSFPRKPTITSLSLRAQLLKLCRRALRRQPLLLSPRMAYIRTAFESLIPAANGSRSPLSRSLIINYRFLHLFSLANSSCPEYSRTPRRDSLALLRFTALTCPSGSGPADDHAGRHRISVPRG